MNLRVVSKTAGVLLAKHPAIHSFALLFVSYSLLLNFLNFARKVNLIFHTTEKNRTLGSSQNLKWSPGSHSSALAHHLFWVCFFQGYITQVNAVTNIFANSNQTATNLGHSEMD